jgi:hypothetical protein
MRIRTPLLVSLAGMLCLLLSTALGATPCMAHNTVGAKVIAGDSSFANQESVPATGESRAAPIRRVPAAIIRTASDVSQHSGGSEVEDGADAKVLPDGDLDHQGDAFDAFDLSREEGDQGHIGDNLSGYAFLKNRVAMPRSGFVKFLQERGLLRSNRFREGRVEFRPFARWTEWMNRRAKFVPSLVLLLLASGICWNLFPQRLATAEAECASSYWRSLASGVFAFAISIFMARCLLLTQIGWPLAILLIGTLQLCLVLGLAISCSMVGKSFSFYLRVSNWNVLTERTTLMRCIELFAGALVLAAVLQIGAPLGLPRLGTRLVTLLALVGVGALYRTRTDCQPRA